MMFETSQQLHDILNVYSSMYVPYFVNFNQSEWKQPKSGKIRPKFGFSWPAYGHYAWPHDHCSSKRNVLGLGWLHPVLSDAMGIQLGASHMIARHRENPEHVKGKSRSRSTRITNSEEDTSFVRIANNDDTQPRGPFITCGTWDNQLRQWQQKLLQKTNGGSTPYKNKDLLLLFYILLQETSADIFFILTW